MMEIGFDQETAVRDLFTGSGQFTDVQCIKDMGGRPRVVKCRLQS
jgi:methylase of polypeptide subunit release factors